MMPIRLGKTEEGGDEREGIEKERGRGRGKGGGRNKTKSADTSRGKER